jgi:hypothetical protein
MDHNKSPLNNKEKRHLLKRKCYQVEVEETTREGEGKTAKERKGEDHVVARHI